MEIRKPYSDINCVSSEPRILKYTEYLGDLNYICFTPLTSFVHIMLVSSGQMRTAPQQSLVILCFVFFCHESDVTHDQVWWPILRTCALHSTHPKCTHTAVNTHKPWTHILSRGQPLMLQRLGSSWGFGALLKGTSVVVLRVERVHPHAHSLPPPTIPTKPETQTRILSITRPTL